MAFAIRRSGILFVLSASLSSGAAAQPDASLPEIVVTPNYTPTPLNRIGSAFSQVGADEVSRTSPASVTQLLRTVPGVTVIESGGPGGASEVRIRGAETGHTVVLVDGVRVNDIASARGDFDFASLALDDVERIEVLRGPQTAVYGSDAMGGVINIVTKQQVAASSASVTVEGGSYGTLGSRGVAGLRSGDFSLRFAGGYYHADGFSRRGDRDGDERDGVDRTSGSVRLSYAPQNGARVDVGLSGVRHNAGYDSAGTTGGNAPNVSTRQRTSGFATLTLPTVDHRLDQTATAFFSTHDKTNREPLGSIPETVSAARTFGGEYRAMADLHNAGQLTFGARLEHEEATSRSTTLSGFPGYAGSQSLWAVFSEHQLTVADRLHLTFSGRYDGAFSEGEGFLTGRATAAYEMDETDTRLRASIGTGAKRPTAYQTGNNAFAAALPGGDIVPVELKAERSFGVDAGIDQRLFNGALRVSATAFYNRFSNMLGFSFLDAAAGTGYYENIDRAETKGIELTANADIVPGVLAAGATYTWMPTRNLDTGRPLARRPEHSGSVTVTFTPAEGYEAALSAVFVGERLNTASAKAMLPGYSRLDFSTSVSLTDSTKLFARVENLLDARYQDPSGFNTPGLSAYVGLTWKQ